MPRHDFERHPLAIAAAVPAGSVRAPGQVQWLAALEASPVLAQLRADRWANVVRVMRELALCADWETCTSRPTWDRLGEVAGVSRATVGRIVRLVHQAGLLGTVAPGRSAGVVPMALDDGQAWAAVYVLAVPHELRAIAGGRGELVDVDDAPAAGGGGLAGRVRGWLRRPVLAMAAARGDGGRSSVDQTETPSWPPSGGLETNPVAHAREIRALGPAELIAAGPLCDSSQGAQTKAERIIVAAELRRLDPVLRRISTPWLAALLREWMLAGWTVRDVQLALNARPDGSPWPHTLIGATDVRHVPGWVRYRLTAWRTAPEDPTSPPRRSPSQRAAAARHQAQARARARAERHTAARKQTFQAANHAGLQAAKALLRDRPRSPRGWTLDAPLAHVREVREVIRDAVNGEEP